MVRVALTGGIATGKSFCLTAFSELGVPVIDADLLAREAVAPGSRGLADVVRRFGADVLDATGSLDRAALGRLVFSNPAARADLESIVHPHVYRRISTWFDERPSDCRVAIADIPLLFETGRDRDFDRVVVCACRPEEQLRRVMARDRLAEPDAKARIAAQWPILQKISRADYVIRTDGTLAETEQQVRGVLEQLTADTSNSTW